MNSIDEDAIDVLGINPKVWRKYRGMTDEKYVQQEFESVVSPIDDKEAKKRHLESIRNRWFGYYRKCKDKKKKLNLIDQYNYLAKQR